MGAFIGTLNQNEIFNSIYNMIISQEVFGDNIKGTYAEIVDAARVDGSLYGDKKLYYATDVLESHVWGNDSEAPNLLNLDRPADPSVQEIVLDKFRQIRCTIDNYLSKRAFSTEGAFSSFNAVMLGWIRDTKRVYDSRLYNTFIGTDVSNVGKQTQTIALPAHESGEEAPETEAVNRLRGEKLAEAIANLLVDMKDATRDYNDYGYLRSYADGEIKVIWNSKYVNEVKKLDLPTIFHKDGLVSKMDEFVLPGKYFGTVQAESGTSTGVERALVEMDGSVSEKHYFPGDVIESGDAYGANEAYIVDEKVICKIVTKLPPFMSAFEVGTSFFNPRSLTENHYLTWGYNTLEHLKNFPMITIKEA